MGEPTGRTVGVAEGYCRMGRRIGIARKKLRFWCVGYPAVTI
jgi:hypothetical protein